MPSALHRALAPRKRRPPRDVFGPDTAPGQRKATIIPGDYARFPGGQSAYLRPPTLRRIGRMIRRANP